MNLFMPIIALVLAVRHHMQEARRPPDQRIGRHALRALAWMLGLIGLAYGFLYATECGGFLAGTILDPWTHTC